VRSNIVTTWRRRLFRPEQPSALVARGHYRHALRVPVEEHVIWIGPPRSGKTGPLASIIAGYPGPVAVTTTRADLYELTAAARADRGRLRQYVEDECDRCYLSAIASIRGELT
jgi:hypothetical protein